MEYFVTRTFRHKNKKKKKEFIKRKNRRNQKKGKIIRTKKDVEI